MKVLESIGRSEIPMPGCRNPQYEDVYRRALSLNGLVLPVEFETAKQATGFAIACHQRHSRAKGLGLVVALRGNTVFLYRKREEA